MAIFGHELPLCLEPTFTVIFFTVNSPVNNNTYIRQGLVYKTFQLLNRIKLEILNSRISIIILYTKLPITLITKFSLEQIENFECY